MGPRREFAIFEGVQDEHRAHDSPDNLLRPYRLDVEGNRAKHEWEIPSLDLVFTATLSGGSRGDCESWYVLLEPPRNTSPPERGASRIVFPHARRRPDSAVAARPDRRGAGRRRRRRAGAQTAAETSTQTAAQPPAETDALGRDTPRGTVLGFMNAARAGKTDVTPLYLDTNLTGQAATDLANQLYVVLDSRLPVRLSQLSDRPEGTPDNPLQPDLDVIGTISTKRGPFELVLERVTRPGSRPAWLFSRQTLALIPEAYSEVNLVAIDRYLPGSLMKFRIAGIRLFEWLGLLIVLPFCYGLFGSLNWLFRPVAVRWHRRFGDPREKPADHIPGLFRWWCWPSRSGGSWRPSICRWSSGSSGRPPPP